MKEKIKYVFYGIIMGIANVIPGVSGGTMAIILNFYDRLMESITFNLKVIKKNISFLVPLGIGLVIGILGLSKVMNILLSDYPTQTYFAFIGIIIGSLPLIWSKVKRSDKKIQTSSWIALIITLAIMISLAFFSSDKDAAPIKYTSFSIEACIMCFISMTIGASTMIIPGISGSMMLLIMGMYGTVFGFVISDLYIPLLIPTALGAVVGLFGGAKLITILLNKYEQLTYMAILGLLVGSMAELFKRCGILQADILTVITSIIAGVVMFAIVYLFSLAEMKRDKKEVQE